MCVKVLRLKKRWRNLMNYEAQTVFLVFLHAWMERISVSDHHQKTQEVQVCCGSLKFLNDYFTRYAVEG